MRILLAASAFLLLAACAPDDLGFRRDPPPSSATSSSAVLSREAETATGDLAVTPEPFVDPLAPVAMTGTVKTKERTHSGALFAIGSAKARIAMDVFLNPESPYAREFQRSRMPRVVSDFVATGRLSVRYHVVPIEKYAGSADAARTIACAAAQGKGYPALDVLFRDERATLDQDDVTELELDAITFLSCLQETTDPFAASGRAIEQWGVTLVPTYVIHGGKFVGLPTEADLRGAIRAAL